MRPEPSSNLFDYTSRADIGVELLIVSPTNFNNVLSRTGSWSFPQILDQVFRFAWDKRTSLFVVLISDEVEEVCLR